MALELYSFANSPGNSLFRSQSLESLESLEHP